MLWYIVQHMYCYGILYNTCYGILYNTCIVMVYCTTQVMVYCTTHVLIYCTTHVFLYIVQLMLLHIVQKLCILYNKCFWFLCNRSFCILYNTCFLYIVQHIYCRCCASNGHLPNIFSCTYSTSLNKETYLKVIVLRGIHICIYYQNINTNFLIKMLYVLWLYFSTIDNYFYNGSNIYLL